MIYVNLSKKYPCEKMLGSNIAFPQEESSMVLQAQNSFVFLFLVYPMKIIGGGFRIIIVIVILYTHSIALV